MTWVTNALLLSTTIVKSFIICLSHKLYNDLLHYPFLYFPTTEKKHKKKSSRKYSIDS